MHSLREALDMAALTDTGRVREHNEDALFYDANLGIVVLADGMGGHLAGEVASGLTVEVVSETLRAELAALQQTGCPERKHPGTAMPGMLDNAVRRANAVVFERSRTDPQCYGMGTTLVCAVFCDDGLSVAHVGDSRLYRHRGGVLVQLTRDHSVLQEQLDAGLVSPEDARGAACRNLVTRAVGIRAEAEPEIRQFGVVPGDVYLFCSDGLTDMLEDDLIGRVIGFFSDNLSLAAQALVEQANASGGRDNVSVVLVAVKRHFPARSGWFSRLSALRQDGRTDDFSVR